MRSPTTPFPAHTLIRQPDVPASVTRQANDDLLLQWRQPADNVAIYATTSPHNKSASQQLFKTVVAADEVLLTDPEPTKRYYFRVVFADGRSLTTAERILPLQKAVNFRDVGGYETEDGRCLKWGHLYRSGNLHRLTPADQQYLEQLGLKLVCDLRSKRVTRRRPDRLLPASQAKQCHFPMRNPSRWFGLQTVAAILFRPSTLQRLMLKGYIKLAIEGNTAVIGDTLRQLAHPHNLPTLIHCAAGKDRTGIIIALLLALLGVPEATIIADYSLSNIYYDHFARAIEPNIRLLRRWGTTTHDLYPFHIAHPQTLRDTFSYIRQEYGSILHYLRDKVGLDQQTISQLQHNLLEENGLK